MYFDQRAVTPPVYVVTEDEVLETGTGEKMFGFDVNGLVLSTPEYITFVPWAHVRYMQQARTKEAQDAIDLKPGPIQTRTPARAARAAKPGTSAT